MNRLLRTAIFLGLVLAAIATAYVATAPEGRTDDIDAVFVHAGGTGERVEKGVDIWRTAPAGTILILSEAEPVEQMQQWCDAGDPAIRCTPPNPATTLGEAAMLDEIAREMALQRVAIVTSDYHLRRATLLDERCSSVDVVPVSAGNEIGAITLIGKYLHEFGGLLALAFAECPP